MSTYPTPNYSHAGRGDFQDVYEPAEDSFLLIDALEKDAEKLKLTRSELHTGGDLNGSIIFFMGLASIIMS